MPKTYLFSGNAGVIYDRLKQLLESAGYQAYPNGKFVSGGQLLQKDSPCGIEYVDFLFVEVLGDAFGYDHNTYTIRCDWHSLHDAVTEYPIIWKDRLHASLRNTGIVAKTWELAEFEYSDGVFIIRPAHMLASSGMDITVVASVDEFDAAKDFYQKKIEAHSKYHKIHMQHYGVIVSEYISRPMLFEGRKFHLRLYGLSLSTRPGYFIARGHGKILTAAKPFVAANWSDKDIHDTHLKGTLRDLLFPDDFERQDLLDDINKQLDHFETEIVKLTEPRPYPQARQSFSIYGLDIMITEDGRLVLIEINDRAGFAFIENGSKKHKELSRRHCEWIASFIL